ncbi:MAG: bifunctional glutamate N-acetyltransferase/amino-acid acetyltransferase ArgJ [Kofleriaceae bacterium]
MAQRTRTPDSVDTWTCPGFRFAGARGGIKAKAGLDVGLIATRAPASAAAVFTQNRVPAAPVRLARAAMAKTRGKLGGVVVSSGNANACTGAQGHKDARAMAAMAATQIGCTAGQVLVASTGVIGQPLPMPKIAGGIAAAGAGLRDDGWRDFAHAILTTDKRAKVARREFAVGRHRLTLLGCTKGAGMIMPNMATTLTFVVTDAAIAPRALDRCVRAAVEPTYNAIAVDGDTSTNDTLAVLASGATGPALAGRSLAAFGAALTELLDDLATQLMGDGEGVHHVVRIEITGAASARAAQAVARRVATSPLVKTAIAGGDPNWGRLLCAVGNASVPVRPDRLALSIGDVRVVTRGAQAPGYVEARAAAVMKRPQYAITIDLGAGRHRAHYLACDLSHGYVEINADYRS